MRSFYPIMTDLTGRRCLVVGGGRVAERKIGGLLDAGADVTVISPEVTGRIARWEAEGRIEVIRREYAGGDGDGAALVFASTDSSEVNGRVWEDAVSRGQPVNVADRPELCTFVVPAVWRHGHLLVAVSTSGTSPMASSRIRDRIEAAIGDGIDAFLEFAAEYRVQVLSRVSDPGERRRLLAELFSDAALDAVRAGEWDGLRSRMEAELNRAAPDRLHDKERGER
ncbi:bifunctional precorrin-2 dehydrogenase/sirohydrochlorin ferrochelatase [Paenibacillus mesophilus]|uniref:precorrin-2 dehydrogenase/sirohydrochlorin ferrochelatase family protein n=1 Tax=Paenibacillus mesophilus TaxID=2582849 RepID=UPI00110D9FF8|nr:bifunctional precorrin-2 dehydrogenase/sirohydrochlorin ferrochelatase [Paenibacillus mesophilus]TMV52940.1 bifunctional precorrin-2 dehydrogenase/sirohydrochlorin ferrochelatase [Paenibacillus mesophilus]